MTSIARSARKELKPVRKRGFFATLGSQWQLMIMSVPMFLYVLFFNYYPMYFWITAFQDYKPKLGVAGSKFVGLKNFEWLFGRADFINSIRNTLAMSVINLVFGTVAAVLLAVLLNEVRNRKFKRTVQTVTYLPHFLSMVIVVGMAQNLFASTGSINELLMGLGLVKEPVFFLGEGKYFWWMVGVINVWKEVGWGTIIYISAMTAIDPCLYEAASIDGATGINQFFNITVPLLSPTTFFIVQTRLIGALTVFDLMFMVMDKTNVALSKVQSIVYLFYTYAFTNGNKGYGATIVIVLVVFIMIITFIMQKAEKTLVYHN
jgi:ABC-type polysaccharide transport system permease subunit